MIFLLFFVVTFAASLIGSACGIGGGIIIKPTLDALQLGSASEINFLSGCTVLSMCLYSVLSALKNTGITIQKKTMAPLAVGAAAGGIVGGPINLMVLYYFFSMDTKNAAINSLFIILFSQTASLLSTILTNRVPSVSGYVLAVMVVGGIAGGVVGRRLNRLISDTAAKRMLIAALVLICLITLRNIILTSE